MPSTIFTPRFQQLLRRTFQLIGPSALQVDDTVLPVANVFNPAAPDLYFLRGENLFSAAGNANGGAGLFGTVSLNNPLGSGYLTVLEWIIVSVQVTAVNGFTSVVGQLQGSTLGASDGNNALMDSRGSALNVAPRFSQSFVSQSQTGGLALNHLQFFGSQAAPIIIPMRVILKPGTRFDVANGTSGAGNTIGCTFLGYERPTEPPEVGGPT